MNIHDLGTPFDSSTQPKQKEISDIQERVAEDSEVTEALDQLVYCLEHAFKLSSENLAWETFNDRINAIITRAKAVDEHETNCGIG